MRWFNTNPNDTPQLSKGDVRRVRLYAYLPVTIDYETRWLEWYDAEQVIIQDYYAQPLWSNVAFINSVAQWDIAHSDYVRVQGHDHSFKVYFAYRKRLPDAATTQAASKQTQVPVPEGMYVPGFTDAQGAPKDGSRS